MRRDIRESPAVSVILPTYNRASFLPDALDSIRAQSFTDWELIVVDDGSTDDTRAVIDRLASSLGSRLRYVYQSNRGAYAARNHGLDEAAGRYIAFLDSDDLWLPHHLERCTAVLDADATVDWAFGACRLVDHDSGVTIEANTFHPGGQSRPFLGLKARPVGTAKVITDPEVLSCQISHGLYCGLQNSVIRRRVFERDRFDEKSRVVDDEMFVIRALAEGVVFAFLDEVHVVYRVHSGNSSGSATGVEGEKDISIFQEMTASLGQILNQVPLRAQERRALRKRLAREYFWHLGYMGYWQNGQESVAIDSFRRGLALWPWDMAALKTYVLARLKLAFQRMQ
jgi:glycosyltransferase involved in cell wall biosynthesis